MPLVLDNLIKEILDVKVLKGQDMVKHQFFVGSLGKICLLFPFQRLEVVVFALREGETWGHL